MFSSIQYHLVGPQVTEDHWRVWFLTSEFLEHQPRIVQGGCRLRTFPFSSIVCVSTHCLKFLNKLASDVNIYWDFNHKGDSLSVRYCVFHILFNGANRTFNSNAFWRKVQCCLLAIHCQARKKLMRVIMMV